MNQKKLKALIEESFQKSDNIFQFKNDVLALVDEHCNDKQIVININNLNPDLDVKGTLAKHGDEAIRIMTEMFNNM